jgi:hypothetical protein
MLIFMNFLRTQATAMSISPEVKYYLQFLHPVLMWVLLGLSTYAMYLGFQSRQVRYAEGEQKKALIKGKFAVRHYQIGSLILALMVLGTISGMAVTYLNNGKLFVGPHLLAGMGMTGLIAAAAALSPLLQKGQDWARYTHIALNVVILGLFGWQAITGMQIVQKILGQA